MPKISQKRDTSIDFVKAIACILVAVFHMLMGLEFAGILNDSDWFQCSKWTAYSFHVYLFFVCSGYLYQKKAKINSIKDYGKNSVNKLVALGVPFVVFSSVLYFMKIVFSGQVNTQMESSYSSIFTQPLAPYWYLYILFFIFLITPLIRKNWQAIAIVGVAFAAKCVTFFLDGAYLPYIAEQLFVCEIWFVIGMLLQKYDLKKLFGLKSAIVGVLFLPLAIVLYITKATNNFSGFIVGLLAFILVFSLANIVKVKDNNRVFSAMVKYNMPVFLMHTIFAAGTRALLVKVGVDNLYLHIVAGLVASFAFPMLAGLIIDKIKFLRFIMYPPKVFR
jgi:fucose 4-O-acetylase-like acetyltransferase